MNQSPDQTYTTEVKPFAQPSPLQSNNWVLWDSDADNPLTLSFPSTLPVKSVWIPALTGPVTFYEGTTPTGTPFYVSQGAGSELIPIPIDQIDVTLVGSGGDMYVYSTSLVLNPFRQGTIGNQVTEVTATAPITSSGGTTPNIALTNPLAIGYGGTGTATPVGVQAASMSGITVTGSFPDQTIGTDFSGLGVVTAVTASAPLSSTGGTTPNISIGAPIPLSDGGTNQTAPALNAGAGIAVTGTIFQPSGGSAWTVTNDGITSITTDDSTTDTGDQYLRGQHGIVTSTSMAGGHSYMNVDGSAFPLSANLESSDGSIDITVTGQTADFTIANSAIGAVIVREAEVTGTNPSASLNLPTLPAGTWLVETYIAGLGLTQGDSTPTAQIALNTGETAAINGVNYERYLAITKKVSGSPAPSCALTTSGGTTVVSGWNYASFVLKATRLS